MREVEDPFVPKSTMRCSVHLIRTYAIAAAAAAVKLLPKCFDRHHYAKGSSYFVALLCFPFLLLLPFLRPTRTRSPLLNQSGGQDDVFRPNGKHAGGPLGPDSEEHLHGQG